MNLVSSIVFKIATQLLTVTQKSSSASRKAQIICASWQFLRVGTCYLKSGIGKRRDGCEKGQGEAGVQFSKYE